MTCSRSRGFTLLEMMLVIVLLASVAMLVSGALPRREASVQQESRRLLNVLHWAQEQSMLDGEIYGLTVTQHGWQLLRICQTACEEDAGFANNVVPDSVWVIARQKSARLQRQLEGIDFQLEVENHPQKPGPQGSSFSEPQILFYPGGESSQFWLTLSHEEQRQTLGSDGAGWVQFRKDIS